MTEKFTFFYGGIASQWYACKFRINGIDYNCAEQYMMAEKARLFGDADALDIIMNTADPKVQKAAGRTVKNFDPVLWARESKVVVFRANMAKYMQNPKECQWLLSTAGTTLVEASPWDTIWGIGLDANNPLALDRATWKGTNWLGEIETQVRDDIAAYRFANAGTDKLGRVKFIDGKAVPNV